MVLRHFILPHYILRKDYYISKPIGRLSALITWEVWGSIATSSFIKWKKAETFLAGFKVGTMSYALPTVPSMKDKYINLSCGGNSKKYQK